MTDVIDINNLSENRVCLDSNPFAQVNYGTGKDVSDESIADAKEALEVRWYNDSVVRVPVSDR